MTIQRVFVSDAGSDTATGTRADPCRTFAGAIPKVNAGGFIVCQDTADFGPFSIDKSVSVFGVPGASIDASLANGINVTAGQSARVLLDGIDLVGIGDAGTIGLNITGGAAIYMRRCNVSGFRAGSAIGINHAPPAGTTGRLHLRECLVRDCGIGNDISGGILVKPNLTGKSVVTIDDCDLLGNSNGLIADGNGNTGYVSIGIHRSQICSNDLYGVFATSVVPGSLTVVHIKDTSLRGNGMDNSGAGIFVDGNSCYVNTDENTINRNFQGVKILRGGTWGSTGRNTNVGNNGIYPPPDAVNWNIPLI